MSVPRVLRLRALTPALADAWAGLFDACSSGCFCRYWSFEGTKNEWLARLAQDPSANEREARARLAAGEASAGGLLAFDGELAVGWMKLVPRVTVPKLRRLPVYRAMDLGDDDGVLSVGCLLVHPSHRRRGVARALVRAGVGRARDAGARLLEAYPHRRGEALREEELWMGPLALYEQEGFTSVEGIPAYPVMRHNPAAARHATEAASDHAADRHKA